MVRRRSALRPTTLASMWRASTEDGGSAPAVFGSHVFQSTIFGHLVRHGGMDRHIVVASPFDRPALARSLERLVAGGTRVRSVEVKSTTSLIADRGWLSDVTAWHEVGDRWQFAAELRRASPTLAYPITATCHAFGYRDQLHDLYTRMLLLDLRPYDAFICTSRAARTAFERLLASVTGQLERAHGTKLAYAGRVETIPLGVDVDRFRPGDKPRARAALGIPSGSFVLLAFGRLSFVDKADLFPLLLVFRDLVVSHPRRKLQLVLAGSSLVQAKAMLARHAAELGLGRRVRIVSPVSDREREHLYAAADVFVSPADNVQEAFGQTPLEAMASGVPQVVSDWDGYRDTVVDGQTGFLVPTYWARADRDLEHVPFLDWDLLDHAVLSQSLAVDVNRLRAALATLIENDALRERFARASRERALAEFGWNVVVARYETLWRELSADAGRLRFRPDRRLANVRSRFFEMFRAYPTELLDDDTPLRASAEGRRVLAGRAPLPAYFVAAAELLDLDVLVGALERLARPGATLGAVARAVRRPNFHEDHARRHVLWHLKQGFAELVPTPQRRRRNLNARTSRGS